MPPRPTRTSVERRFAGIDEPIRITRSRRRKSTIAARRTHGVFELLVPSTLSQRSEEEWVRKMYAKYAVRRGNGPASDADLEQRAQQLAARYLPDGIAPASVRWVTNQNSRWGSCTSADRSIRLSHELREMPQYVIDSVLVHELAHLVHPNHGPEFRAIEAQFERLAEARAFLEGATHAKNRGLGR